ncbi:hypothetical protein OI70_21415 [Dickeya fangzhongdai]|nr:hypothetical protein OI70_21415 [Dickeya fangzhongdai]
MLHESWLFPLFWLKLIEKTILKTGAESTGQQFFFLLSLCHLALFFIMIARSNTEILFKSVLRFHGGKKP